MASAILPRLLSVILTVYSVLVIAVVTGVVVNFYTQVMNLKNDEAFNRVLDQMEHLPDLSKEELVALSDKIKNIRNK